MQMESQENQGLVRPGRRRLVRVTPKRNKKGNQAAWVLCAVLGAATFVLLAYHSRLAGLVHPFRLESSLRVQSPLRQMMGCPSNPGEISPNRPVYPYSIIAGGAGTAEELRAAVCSDPLVARHYRDFNLSMVHTVRLQTDESAYVSYRIGDKIFWTRHKLILHRGEVLLTDGVNYARTRCGNRVSQAPIPKTSALEPAPKTFETPTRPAGRVTIPALITGLPPSQGMPALPVEPYQLAGLPGGVPNLGGPGTNFAAVPSPMFGNNAFEQLPTCQKNDVKQQGCAHNVCTKQTPQYCNNKPTVTGPTPEPATLFSFAAGVAGLLALMYRKANAAQASS
jgi:hypothetical protein